MMHYTPTCMYRPHGGPLSKAASSESQQYLRQASRPEAWVTAQPTMPNALCCSSRKPYAWTAPTQCYMAFASKHSSLGPDS